MENAAFQLTLPSLKREGLEFGYIENNLKING